MQLIDGQKISKLINEKTKRLIQANNLKPKLVIIYVGKNPASEIYINKKIEKAKEVGINAEVIRLKESTTKELLEITTQLNLDPSVTGYIIQLPVPKNINLFEVLKNIDVRKDVDGLSPYSLGLLFHSKKSPLISATVRATISCIQYGYKLKYGKNIDKEKFEEILKGKNTLIINSSILIGKPLTALLLNYKSTVNIAHKNTRRDDLKTLINMADIIITATGTPGTIKIKDLKNGQVIIDIGIKRLENGKVVGDVDISDKELINKEIYITPVPNGIGPVTVAELLHNVALATNIKK